jgi:7-cyano-7-deazaguanine synthase
MHYTLPSEFKKKKCLLVFSGGQDSTTCLFWAKHFFKEVHAVFFRYGQRHSIEENSARIIAEKWDIPLTFLDINTFSQLGGNSLIDKEMDIKSTENDELPNTFVPGRNLIFMTYAAAFAYSNDIEDLITGVCETDYSGYPDCRTNTMEALESALSLGMDRTFKIHTPLMHMSKAETVVMAKELGGLSALAYSHTCYEGAFPPCGKCPSCILRAKGFAEAGLPDPILARPAE